MHRGGVTWTTRGRRIRPNTVSAQLLHGVEQAMTDDAGRAWWEGSVRAALLRTWDQCAGGDLLEAFMVLSQELRTRGIYPEPGPVFDWAVEISRGKEVAVLGPELTRRPVGAPRAGRRRAEVSDDVPTAHPEGLRPEAGGGTEADGPT